MSKFLTHDKAFFIAAPIFGHSALIYGKYVKA